MKTTTTGWQVLKASISQRNGGLYVEGVNHESSDPLFKNFYWHINKSSLRDARFDFTGCDFAPGALCHYAKMIEA